MAEDSAGGENVMSTFVPEKKADLTSIEDLAQILHSLLSPPASNESHEALSSGDPQVQEIEEALDAPGRTVFIFGDVAGGKTPRLPGEPVGADTIGPNAPFSLVLKAGEGRKEDTVVVIDEFDETTAEADRTRFAEFIKQIEERRLPIRFVLCGVSESVKKLLGAHESSYHCLEDMDLTRTSPDARFEIIETSPKGLSKGSPHYVHLVSEKLFWEMFNDPTFARSLI